MGKHEPEKTLHLDTFHIVIFRCDPSFLGLSMTGPIMVGDFLTLFIHNACVLIH